MKQKAPVIVFAYSRADHILKTLEALDENRGAEDTDLFIYADGPKNDAAKEGVQKVRKAIEKFQEGSRFRKVEVRASEINNGLSKSIIKGVSEVIKEYGTAIVIEDDIVTTRDFLDFMNEGLAYYKNEPKVWQLAGYTNPLLELETYKPEVWFSRRTNSWGWATWRDRWESVDWELKDYEEAIKQKAVVKDFAKIGGDLPGMLAIEYEKNFQSWDSRFTWNAFRRDMYTVTPKVSKVRNIGMDASGEHCGVSNKFDTKIKESEKSVQFIPFKRCKRLETAMRFYHHPSLFHRGMGKIKHWIYVRIPVK